ncbi:hypothetical protein AAG570_002730 [Ranatra chinensis]|uniref:Uncharacterized protein n=1 Tax=Ranatra chinensis TaxID=642074 RepID=A0ABD0Y9B8_9HEMI
MFHKNRTQETTENDVVFGISSSTQKKEMIKYLEAVTSLINVATERVISVFHFDIVFKLSGTGKKFNKDVETVDNFANKIIEERLSEAKSGQRSNSAIGASEDSESTGKVRQLCRLAMRLQNNDLLWSKDAT